MARPGTIFTALLAVAALLLSTVSSAATVEQRLQRIERQLNRLSELVLEVQQLRTELSGSHGSVEELGHQQQRLQQSQQRLYLDLDERLRRLEQGVGTASAASGVSESRQSEEDAYNRAFARVRNNQTQPALEAMNHFVRDYPQGDYVGDAWYWIGKLHLIGGDREAAGRAFAQARAILTTLRDSNPGSAAARRAEIKLNKIP